MTWLDEVDNGRFLAAMYDGRAPSLDPVDLHEVLFHRDGPAVTLRFDLPEFPTKPPKGWESYNGVAVELLLIGVSSSRLDGWATTMTGPLLIARQSRYTVSFTAPNCALNFASDAVRVHAARPYLQEH
jgi:hypothetical protein